MIVRIATEDQYEIPDDKLAPLNDLDNAVVAAVQAGDNEAYVKTFAQLIDFVRTNGHAIPDDALRESDIIIPPADTDIEEAAHDFTGDGLIPDTVLPGSGE